MKKQILSAALLSLALAAPAAAQAPRISVEPYAGYGFYGSLPDGAGELEADVAYGARGSFHLSPQWALFGSFQRSTPQVVQQLPLGFRVEGGEVDVDHWSAGVEFSYVPRGGAEGMLPVLLEAGLGQVRYAGGQNDLAANLGIASALRLSRGFAIRYGANDYISNFDGDRGITNQVFVRVGAELSF